jgi:hypothetical protein
MSGDDKENLIRSLFAVRCRDPLLRTDGRKLQIANRWEPFTVRHPELHAVFTEAGAWDFIADCLEGGEKLNSLPPTQKFPDYAIYMLHAPVSGGRRIYIKIALRQELNMVIGVSFHYSTEEYSQ